MESKINIRQVLASIQLSATESEIVPFSLKYMKMGNRTMGELGFKSKVAVNRKFMNQESPTVHRQPSTVSRQKKSQKGFKYNLKETGNLLLRDLITNQPFTVKFFSILEFNGQPVYYE